METSDTDRHVGHYVTNRHVGHYVRNETGMADEQEVFYCVDCDLQFKGRDLSKLAIRPDDEAEVLGLVGYSNPFGYLPE